MSSEYPAFRPLGHAEGVFTGDSAESNTVSVPWKLQRARRGWLAWAGFGMNPVSSGEPGFTSTAFCEIETCIELTLPPNGVQA